MKRATTMLGALALAVAGFLFAVPAANAQAILQTANNGGVTCNQYSTGYASYPYTFWDCIDTANPPTSFEKLVGQSARTMSTSMKATLDDVEIMIFDNKADFQSFTGNSSLNPPRTFDMGWYAPSAPPAQLAGKKIAAVFATADLYSPSDHLVLSRNLDAHYKTHIMLSLGRQYNVLAGPTPISASGGTFYALVSTYDRFWMNEETVTTVWNAQIAAMFPGKTPYEVLGELYGNVASDIFAFQFATEFGSTWSHLNQFINGWLEETEGYRKQQVFQHSPIQPVNTINNVVCVQYDVIYNAPADKIWDCVHPYNATAGERFAGSGVGNLPSGLRALLGGTSLYTFYDYDAFNKYVQPSPLTPQYGTGGSGKPSTLEAGAFATIWINPGDPTPLPIENYYKGTLVHEVGHFLDEQWGPYAPPGQQSRYSNGTGTGTWGDAVNLDKAQFNTLNCTVAIGDSSICSAYPTLSNWDIFIEITGLNNPGQDVNKELFAYMFQKRSGNNTYVRLQYIENKLWSLPTPNMKNKLDYIWSNSHP